MKFSRRSKYFLRGMGFGILVTVVLFSVALVFYEPNTSSAESDTETVSEDKKQETDTDQESTTKETKEETKEEVKEEANNESDTAASEETKDDTAEETKDDTVEEESKVATTEANTPSNFVSFKVTAGESSSKVAENLYRAGLIDNPSAFNTYLEQNGYDNTIHVGTFNIPEGSTYEQIANTISK